MKNTYYKEYSEKRLRLDQLVSMNIYNYNVKNKDLISQLKKEVDLEELNIIDLIYSNDIDYEKVYEYLKKKDQHDFLDKSYKLKNYLTTRSITQNVENYKKERLSLKEEYKMLCEQVWKDGIISKDERQLLDTFCKKNKIDSISQHFLETEVLEKLKILDLNFNEIIEFYFKNENLDSKQIQILLKVDYKQRVDLQKIEDVITEIEKRKKTFLQNNSDVITLFKLTFDNKDIHVISTKSKLNTCYSFEIAFPKNNIHDDFKIIVKKEIAERNNLLELTDVITDAICYKSTRGNNLSEFLEMKEFVKKEVLKQIKKN